MELPKIRKPRGEMLSGIKSKLGFADDSPRDDYAYDEYADDGFQGDFDGDYGEYGYSDDGYDSYGSYDDRGGYADYSSSSSRRSSYSRSRDVSARDDLSPKLVSIDDVRARTQIPDRLNRDPLPQRHVTSAPASASTSTIGTSSRRDRVLIDNTAPSPGSPESMRAERSAGLSSLFEPTTSASQPAAESGVASAYAPTAAMSATPAASTSAASASTSFDPYDAFAGSQVAAHAPQRGLSVIKPATYGDVERVAKAVRAGDVAVLCLKATPDDLAKRVLDFSFGVASYAEARVDCIADKVFAIARGDALSESELLVLRGQGVI